MDLKELKKLKKNQLIKIIKENNDYKKKYLLIQEENFDLVIKLNEMKENMNMKIEEILNNDDNVINYLKKRISQTQNTKKEKYLQNLKKYAN